MRSAGVLALMFTMAVGSGACSDEKQPEATVADSTSLPPPRAAALTVSTAQFGRLRWIEGRWRGIGSGTAPFYEGYRFADDSTIRQYSYPDSSALTANDSGEVALRNGSVVTGSAGARWVVAELDTARAHFVPDQSVTNSFTWKRQSADSWVATLTWPASEGKPARETVYQMQRMTR